MREIRTSGSMSGEGRRSDCQRLKPPRPSSTLPLRFHMIGTCELTHVTTGLTPATALTSLMRDWLP